MGTGHYEAQWTHYQDGMRVFKIAYNDGVSCCQICGEAYWDIERRLRKRNGLILCSECIQKEIAWEKKQAEKKRRSKLRVKAEKARLRYASAQKKKAEEEARKRREEEKEKIRKEYRDYSTDMTEYDEEYDYPLGLGETRVVTCITPVAGKYDMVNVTLAKGDGSDSLVLERNVHLTKYIRIGQALRRTEDGKWFGNSSYDWVRKKLKTYGVHKDTLPGNMLYYRILI